MKALETPYNGRVYRSRREARWAKFFYTAHIDFEYEEQGYDLGEAGWYLPDFRVNPRTPAEHFFEVKGTTPTGEELAKAEALCEQSKLPVYVYYADVRLPVPPELGGMTEQAYLDGLFQESERAMARAWLDNPQLGGEILLRRTWIDDIQPTAFRAFRRPSGGTFSKALPLWGMDCPHCSLVMPKCHGQVGNCHKFGDGISTPEPLYPQFSYATKRLQDAYLAASSERFGR